ncbi:Hypothetical protein D9617_9g023930 [Elsinoe fawcettii]|nr:Hypothetical protein D9617_9g023930 [Elsinoe fawcettii]
MTSSIKASLLFGLLSWPSSVVSYVHYAHMASTDALGLGQPERPRGMAATVKDQKGVFFMKRIGPPSSRLYIANTDGSNERQLLPDPVNGTTRPLDYFQSGRTLAYASSKNGYKSNIWIKDLITGEERNLTNVDGVRGNSFEPNAYMRPAWSADGKWIALSSDRYTPWFGHRESLEHAPTMSIYTINVDGSGFRQVVTAGLQNTVDIPKFSADGKRIVYYEADKDEAADGQWPSRLTNISSQIVSVDFETGSDRRVHTEGLYLKLFPQFLNRQGDIGFLVRGGSQEGVNYTSPFSDSTSLKQFARTYIRSPAWSPGGKLVIYEVPTFYERRNEAPLASFGNPSWTYRWIDFFTGSDMRLVTMNPDGSDHRVVFDPIKSGLYIDETWVQQKLEGSMQPSWSPDGEWLVFSLGSIFQGRLFDVPPGQRTRVYRMRADGSGLEALMDGTVNSGMPSFSADRKQIVLREWGGPWGLKIMDLATRETRELTTMQVSGTEGTTNNLPAWSPDGERIVFTRRQNATNFDVCTIRPGGSDLRVLTGETGANDGHAVLIFDGRIAYSTGKYGFKDEAAIYDDTFQPYGLLVVIDAEGGDKEVVSDSMWEDLVPFFVPNRFLRKHGL